MIEPRHLTKNQWFFLCLRIYRALRADDPNHALALLVMTGFNTGAPQGD